MPNLSVQKSGWQGICLIAVTYIYFLIFAQFAFLKRLASAGIADNHLKAVMAAMALGGILLSLLAPRVHFFPSPSLRLRISLVGCSMAASLCLLQLNLVISIGISALIGCSLGLLTVNLVTHLRLWLGTSHPLLKIGLGTGTAYLVCNCPPFFAASPEIQSAVSAILTLTALAITFAPVANEPAEPASSNISFLRVLACFTALIWLDSAAFFIIQNTPTLKAGTWQGTIHLWANGILHITAALAGVWLITRKGLSFLLSAAFLMLASACLLLLDAGHIALASAFYPVGVSLYSVALVAYPSFLTGASSTAERGRQAGWIYAVAGWFGSAMGIGMGQNLGHVPFAFVIVAGAVILLPALIRLLRARMRESFSVAAFALAALLLNRFAIKDTTAETATAAERGRHIYISEGCINCHSQYVRPHTSDVLLWGPAQSTEELHRQHPPLIGNRRQGPDLSEVGNRRSPLWLRAHFYNPAEVSYKSFMPSYAYLFQDTRGNDLLAYLQTLRTNQPPSRLSDVARWSPDTSRASLMAGANLFNHHCATCHLANGETVTRWKTSFRRLPPNLKVGPFLHLGRADTYSNLRVNLAKVIKFGIADTDMPGHEYLSDADIASISLYVASQMMQ